MVSPRADARAGHEAQAECRDILVGIASIRDRTSGGGHADHAGAATGVEAAHGHILRGEVTDGAASRLRHRAVHHGDRAGRRFHVNGAAARDDVPGGLLDHVAVGQHGDPATAGLHDGGELHIVDSRGGGRRPEEDVAGAIRIHGLAHRERAVERHLHDAPVAAGGFAAQESIGLLLRKQRRGVRAHAIHRHRSDTAHNERVVVREEDATAPSHGGQGADGGIEQVSRQANASSGAEPDERSGDIFVRVAVVGDGAGDGDHTDRARAGVQAAQRDAQRGPVADDAGERLGHRAVRHGDRAVHGLHVNRAGSPRLQIARR